MASSNPSAQGGFLKKEGDVLAIEGVGILARGLLDGGGQVKQGEQFVVGEVQVPEQIRGGNLRDLGGSEQGRHITSCAL
jgi:hypothetical protein